jgi:hypothetical protein
LRRSISSDTQRTKTPKAAITVKDTVGSRVEGATVYGTWSGDYGGNVSGVTGADGTVTFVSGKVRQENTEFTFTVTDVVKAGSSYDPALNREDSATITVP